MLKAERAKMAYGHPLSSAKLVTVSSDRGVNNLCRGRACFPLSGYFLGIVGSIALLPVGGDLYETINWY